MRLMEEFKEKVVTGFCNFVADVKHGADELKATIKEFAGKAYDGYLKFEGIEKSTKGKLDDRAKRADAIKRRAEKMQASTP
ncbi:MAG: hypothetical protein CMP22_06305 [Rickettsiales bacterium]|nr:hypothetical protein [Rickettsiales bacterium]